MTTEKERILHEISEAFDFLRFLIHHPKELKRIKNDSTINIFSKEAPTKRKGKSKNRALQTNYLSEHTFHHL